MRGQAMAIWQIASLLLSMGALAAFDSTANAYTEVYELEYQNRRLLVAILYAPDKALDLEREIANQTSVFVEEIFEQRAVMAGSDQGYDFSDQKKVLISMIDLEAVDLERDSLSGIFRAENIIGAIELVYTKSIALDELPLMRRMRAWASDSVYSKAMRALRPADSGAGVAQAKRFSVRKSPGNRAIGSLLAFLAVKYGLEPANLQRIPDWDLPDVTTLIAETKSGAHARVYGALGMTEVFRIPKDPDFNDDRGLSLLRATPSEIQLSIINILGTLDPLPPKISRPLLGFTAIRQLYTNNGIGLKCARVFLNPMSLL